MPAHAVQRVGNRVGANAAGVTPGYMPKDWTQTNSNVRASYLLTENGTAVRKNQQLTTARDLNQAGNSFPNSTSIKVVGQIASWDTTPQSTTVFMECAGTGTGNCSGSTAMDLTGNFVLACWTYSTSGANSRRSIHKGTATATANSTGYGMLQNGSNGLSCGLGATNVATANNTEPSNTWVHTACAFNGTTLQPYLNGVASGAGGAASAQSATTSNFRLGARADNSSAAQQWLGYLNECVVIGASPTAAQVCRIARCGADGSFCECDAPVTGTSGYKLCTSGADAECRDVQGTPICTNGTCSGRLAGTCTGGSNAGAVCIQNSDCTSANCTPCTLPTNCSDAGP